MVQIFYLKKKGIILTQMKIVGFLIGIKYCTVYAVHYLHCFKIKKKYPLSTTLLFSSYLKYAADIAVI